MSSSANVAVQKRPSRGTAGGKGINAQLMRAFRSVALIGLGILGVSLSASFWVRSHTTRLTELRGPFVHNATMALSGLQRSLAGLRGWMLLGEPAFKDERALAWADEIDPALRRLDELQARAGSSGIGTDLRAIRSLLEEIREWQWWTEEVAQTLGNEPARMRYAQRAQPLGDHIASGIAAAIDLEERKLGGPRERMTRLANFRYALAEIQTAVAKFLSDASPSDAVVIQERLGKAGATLNRIAAGGEALTAEQRELVAWMREEFVAYEAAIKETLKLRERPDWNVAKYLFANHAAPLSAEATAMLRGISNDQQELMRAESALILRISHAETTILIVLIIAMAAVAYLVSKRAAARITGPITTLSEATSRLSSGTLTADIPVASDDEVGQLTRSFNQMRASLQESNASLQEREEHLQAVVSSVIDGIITIDEKGTVKSFNQAAERLFGYAREEVLERNVRMLMPDPYHGEHDQYLANYGRTREAKIIGIGREVVGRRKDGSTFPMDLAVSEMRAGAARMFVGIARDITERKKAEEDLRLAKEQAEDANRAKSQFLANMSHELRTPLNAILGYSEMLEESAEDEDRSQDAADAKKIQVAGHHLLELIDSVLDLSKIEAGMIELHLEEFDVVELIDGVTQTAMPLFERKGNTLEVRCDEAVGAMHADLTRVRQVLFNLLSNASKFTDQGTVCLSAVRQADAGRDWLEFAVSDTGIGMTEEQLARIFEPFQQADSSTTRNYGGTGLGLTICREFCQMMGGDIRVESEPGRGSTFTMRLPAAVSAPAGVEAAPEAGDTAPALVPESTPIEVGAEAGRTILVIDDDTSILDLVKRTLTRNGYRVLTAASGAEGIDLARRERPSLITLDVMMPSTDGWAVLSALKEDAALRDIPVVMQTMVADENLGYALGATDYLVKPVDGDTLLRTVEKHVTSAGPGSVLVVEDSEESRELVVRRLDQAGWTVYEAENGAVALEQLGRGEPDLILLDLMMPVMDGFQFIDVVRGNDAWRTIPIVVLTAKQLSAEEQDLLKDSVSSIIRKAELSKDELLQLISDATAS